MQPMTCWKLPFACILPHQAMLRTPGRSARRLVADADSLMHYRLPQSLLMVLTCTCWLYQDLTAVII